MRIFIALIGFILFGQSQTNTFAQEKRSYPSTRISDPIIIDGLENDSVWNRSEWQGDFIQYEPYNGRQPSQPTQFKILYDDNNVFVLIRCFDSSPDSIRRQLARRDDDEGDLAGIQFDSYHDQRTAFSFIVSASGVKFDFLVSNDGESEDASWDPIWFVETSIDALGWLAEMKIPLSQLRFDKTNQQRWGLQVARYIFRRDELSVWQPTPKDAPGWVHQFGSLEGLNGLKPQRQVELAPYYVASLTRNPARNGNPFMNRSDWDWKKIGLDGKIGLSNNFILDLTVNPDFGQVEADPSEVNLTAFETYFSEKRPFFIEGKNLFTYAVMGGDGDISDDGLFYSRRIGRRPQYELELEDNEYADIPEFSKILGAAKITGRTKKGLSVGIMESVTAREVATVDQEGIRRKVAVEPLTSYSAARIQQEMDGGNTILGGMFTATHRDLEDENLKILPQSAYSGGVNFARYWREKKYYFTTRALFSSVQGSEIAIAELQQSSARYFQRPDARHTELDTTRTQLSGWAGRIEAGKMGGGHWRYATFVTFKSPGFETNDIGFLRTTDEITEILWVGYRIWEPFSVFRNLNLNVNQWREYNFDLIKAMDGGNFNFHTQLKNYWGMSGGYSWNGPIRYSTLLRGGPMFIVPMAHNLFAEIETDGRKKWILEFDVFNRFGQENWSKSQEYSIELILKPSSFAQISIEPEYSSRVNEMQYITTCESTFGKRYIFGTVDQHTLDLSVRLNLSITPDISLQYWGQPFIATGNYKDYKRITSPLAEVYQNRYHIFSGNEISLDHLTDLYSIDENGDMAPDYSFEKPDFKWTEFKSNFVFRWEYVPGSTVFLVWSQFRDESFDNFDFQPQNDVQELFSIKPQNIFLLKFSYRFRA